MKYTPFILVLFVFFIFSCEKHCIQGEGNLVSKTVALNSFKGINFGSWGDIELIQSPAHSVKIDAQANVIDLYEFNVVDGILYIKSDKDCFNSGIRPKLYISLTDLNSLKLSGSGQVSTDSSFQTDRLDVSLSGSGKIFLKGSSVSQEISLSGSGDIDLMEMPTQNCRIKISGSGDCRVNVSKELDVRISGSGDVNYKGNPVITQKITGSGNVSSDN